MNYYDIGALEKGVTCWYNEDTFKQTGVTMSETTIGIRDLKAHLGHYLRRVRAGESLVITARGEPIGRLIPAATATPANIEARVADLVAAGLVEWNGQPYAPPAPVIVNRGPRCVSDLLSEDREPAWWAYTFSEAQP